MAWNIDPNTGMLVQSAGSSEPGGGGSSGGGDLSFVTAGASDILAGKVGADTAGNPVYGTLQPGGGSIEFYECASYTPNADAYTKYSMTLSGAADEKANGTYVRTKWVDAVPEDWTDTPIAVWTNENGYSFKEYYYSEFNYTIYNSSGDSVFYSNEPYWSRVTDYSTIVWWSNELGEYVTLPFSAWQTEEVPATTEGWTGYKVTQDTETGAWSRSDTLTEDLTVEYLTPKVGEIYSADTSIRVRKMYDGAVYPIPSDGLVFYAPLTADYVDQISGKAAPVTGGTFTTHNGLSCLQLDGSEYVKWADNADLPSDNSAASVVLLVSPINQSDWRTYMSVGQEGEGHIDISAKNGHFREWGGDRIQVNEWQSLVVTRDDNASGKAYLNGKLNGSGSVGPSPSMSSCVCVGGNIHEGYLYTVNSYVAFAAVYNRELSAEEVAEIHAVLMEDVEQ